MRTNRAVPALGVALFSAAVFFLAGCNRSDEKGSTDASAPLALGEPVKGDVPLACSQCLTDEKVGEIVTIEGQILQQCPASGCWFRMKDAGGEVFVDLAPAKLSLTEKREGQLAKVTGRIAKQGAQFRLQAQHVEVSPAQKDAPTSGK